MVDKRIIERNFSKHAGDYDRHARVQNICAFRLIKKVAAGGFFSILDLGCGTGNYTRLLKDNFPRAKIKAVDISAQMVEIAKEKLKDEKIEFIVADAETFTPNQQFDLISSNASFQWFKELEPDLVRYRQALKERGLILFSTFGPKTFFQLQSCLAELLGRPLLINASNFLARERVEEILNGIFNQVEVEEEVYNQDYGSLRELLESLKYTGTRGDALRGEIFWTPGTIAALGKIYKQRFRKLTATYQIFFCRGVK